MSDGGAMSDKNSDGGAMSVNENEVHQRSDDDWKDVLDEMFVLFHEIKQSGNYLLINRKNSII